MSRLVTSTPIDEHDPLHSTKVAVKAGSGREANAVQEGQRAVDVPLAAEDAQEGEFHVEDLPIIYTTVGGYGMAIDLLEYLLSLPAALTRSFLRIYYRLKPLRSHPRFQALLEEYADDVEH